MTARLVRELLAARVSKLLSSIDDVGFEVKR